MNYLHWRQLDDEEDEIVGEDILEIFRDPTVPRPMHTSLLTGDAYVKEVLEGHPERCRREFRMDPQIFCALVRYLKESDLLKDTRRTSVEEQVAIFIFILGRAGVVRLATERFQHSNETVSRHFNNVLHAITRLYRQYIRPPSFVTPSKIEGNPSWFPYFKDCIGAIDGTHVPVTISESLAEPYRNRKRGLSQNVMVACDFDLKFVYVRAGYEGSASDARVLQHSLDGGFSVPRTKFYLVDAGYANTPNFLAPYRSTRYHLQDFGNSKTRPQNYKELFNRRHASLRSHVERIIGIVKQRFPILKGEKAEEGGPGAATGIILSLRESLQNCNDILAKCQAELEDAQSEIRKWHSAFQNEPAAPSGGNPEPALAVTHLQNLKSSEESLKEKLEKAKKREAAFMVTYAKREQEIADLKSVVRDLKKQLRPPSIQTRRLLLDPAIHAEFTRLKNLVEEKEKKVKELQDNVAAVNFSANSRMGKMLMAKCRTLQEENEEIGAMASEGKIHELGMKIAVLNSQNVELRNQFDALHKHMDGLTNDVEMSNEMVCILQDKLEAKDHELENLKDELSRTKEMLTNEEAKDMEMLSPKEALPKEEMINDDEKILIQEQVSPEDEINCNDDENDEMDPAEVDIET